MYFCDPRFRLKKPVDAARGACRRVGDHVYFKVRGRWKKLPGGTHTHANMAKDLRGKNVLISEYFYYFGRNAIEFPSQLKSVAKGGHRRVTMVPFGWEGRMILIGQCSDCREIRWCYWMGAVREWTGPRQLERSRPLYTPGRGV
jgi:hypothetical protein